MPTSVEQIKERLSIIDVVSTYIKIEKAGINFKARCPFHNERTASFFVSPGRNTYHCFGCNRGGDIFSFVEEIEGVSFPEALNILGNKAGVNIDLKGPRINNEIYYKILEEAVKFYTENLKNNGQAMNYLVSRGLDSKTIEEFKLGFAPNDWRVLLTKLRSKKFNDESIEKAGLAIKSEKNIRDKYYDRFRSRIMFPIFDGQGRVVGFSGRIFPASAPQALGGKYVNSPETVLYNKSKILYGYDKAKRAMLAENFAILVEGQMDLVLAHQIGSTNTIAVSGTALTEDHMNLIKRFTDTLILAFDSDEAGINASLRSFKIALSKGMDIKVLSMPQGLDPADYILKDPDGWKRAVGEAKHIVDFYLDLVSKKGLPDREFQKEISKKVLPLVATIENKIDQAHFVKKIANITFLDENSIREELAKNKEGITIEKTEKPEIISKIIDKVLGFFIWQEAKSKQDIDLNSFQKRFQYICGEKIEERVLKIDSTKRQDLSFEAEIYWAQSHDLKQAVDELLDNFEFEFLEDKLNKLMILLKQIEREAKSDNGPIALGRLEASGLARSAKGGFREEESTLLLKEYQQITKRINEIKNKRHK